MTRTITCKRVGASAVQHVEAIRELAAFGAEAFDYGNALRGLAFEHGDADAFSYPGFVPAYIRPLFCEGKGPFRWVALSGDPQDIYKTDAAILELFGDQEHVARWIRLAREKVQFQGLPARICWLGYGERHLAGLRFNEMVAAGELAGPIVIGRDHLDAGSVASPQRETEAMRDGSDAIADWPILNALLNTACGASWVSVHHGGGVGMGKSIHAGQVVVADGSELGAERVRRVLSADPGTGGGTPRRRGLSRGARVRRAVGPADADAGPRAGRRVSGVSINGAAQVLRPPEDGLPYLRHDRAASLACEPGALLVRDGLIAGFESSGDASLQIDASGCAVIPGFVDCHTHLPFAGWREREYAMKIAGESYEAISRAGGGIRSSARALAAASDEQVLAQSRALADEMLAHGTTAFEGKCGYGLSVEGELRSLRLGAELGADRMTALLAHVDPGRIRRRWLDGGGRADAAARGGCGRGDRARHLRRERSRSRTRTCGGWLCWRPNTGWTCGPTSSSSTTTAQPPSPSSAGRGRSTTSRACRPMAWPDSPSPRPPPCSCPAPSSSAPSTPHPVVRSPIAARSACSPPTSTPARPRSSRFR